MTMPGVNLLRCSLRFEWVDVFLDEVPLPSTVRPENLVVHGWTLGWPRPRGALCRDRPPPPLSRETVMEWYRYGAISEDEMHAYLKEIRRERGA